MTGYGDAQRETDEFSLLVEIKSLNNRFLKTMIRLPDALAFAEPDIERVIRQKLCRGSVSCTLHLRYTSDTSAFDINPVTAKAYLAFLEQIITLHGGKGSMRIDLASLLQLPGVCELRRYDTEQHEKFIEIINLLIEEALTRLQSMRADEGKVIKKDLQQNCQMMRDKLNELSGMTDLVVDQYRQRIQERVNRMLADANLKIDEDLLAKEVAIFAERCDINEEISRLDSHITQFLETCESSQQAGRRLDFLTQEMLREANTIASKSNNATISQCVVDIKVAIDRLKEQVQNVE
jgi:uncharacterized protein (TIGR00255 family)